MSKKLLRGPQIYFGFDDDDDEEIVDGSAHGDFLMSFEAWLVSGYQLDLNEDGDIDELDYIIWWDEQGFEGDPFSEEFGPIERP